MEANELRLGNLVIVPEEVEAFQERKSYINKCVFEVAAIFKNSVKVDIGLDCVQAVSIIEIEPVPLTDQWLLRFGFEKDKRSGTHIQVWYYGENPVTFDWMISLKNTGTGFYFKNGHCKIEYVHQLQNLYFALTGVELYILAL